MFGLADLAGLFPLPPDGVPAGPVTAILPADVAATYRAVGVELEPRRSTDGGVTVWTSAAADRAAMRGLHPRTGLWPVLAGEGFWERFNDQVPDAEPDAGDGRSWLELHLAEPADAPLADQIPRRADLPWQPVDAPAEPDLPGEVVLVPAAVSWLVPAVLGWDGAVNHDIMGPDHTTVLRRWSAAYGAELAGLGSDTMTLDVPRPPTDRDAALRAAVEAVTYCPDAVFQGVGSLEALAEALTAGTWYFWWD